MDIERQFAAALGYLIDGIKFSLFVAALLVIVFHLGGFLRSLYRRRAINRAIRRNQPKW